MKLVHFADLHLDTEFAWIGPGAVSRKRRQGLRETLLRIADLTREVQAEALLCGGDLYEHERFSPDTAAFLRQTFEELDPIRVFLAPGNHDWYGPESLYRRVDWSENVHVFTTPRLAPVELDDGLTLWGAAHQAPAGTKNFLGGFRTDRAGVHLALFHGSEKGGLPEEGTNKVAHAPFDAEEIPRARLDHAFLGHHHGPRDAMYHTYPGNPDPLSFGETGVRGAVVVQVQPDGTVERDRRPVASASVHDLVLDIGSCASRQDVRAQIAERTSGLEGLARITLVGELDHEVDLIPGDLVEAAPSLEAVSIRIGDVRAGYDLGAIQEEPTVRGQFVRGVLEARLAPEEERRVLMTGLRALDGRQDLEVP